MKKIIFLVSVFVLAVPIVLLSGSPFLEQQKKQREMLSRQKQGDLQRKEAVLKKMRLFMKDINERLGFESSVKIDPPLDAVDISDIKEQDHSHTDRKIPPAEWAYVNGSKVRMRSEASAAASLIAEPDFGEKVEILIRTGDESVIGSMSAPWIFVRRSNGNEGWIFGAYLQKNRPANQAESGTGGKGFLVPTAGKHISAFGYRVHPVSRKRNSFHSGIDIAAPAGTPVYAASAGKVKISNYNSNGYGNLIVIEHEENLSTYYGHLSKRLAETGRSVAKGALVGNVGSTGRSTGPHLHFEVRRGSTALDPDAFLR